MTIWGNHRLFPPYTSPNGVYVWRNTGISPTTVVRHPWMVYNINSFNHQSVFVWDRARAARRHTRVFPFVR